MEASSIWILSIVLLFASFLGITLIAKFLTKPIDLLPISFMRIFPFEVPNNLGKFETIYKTLTYLFAIMAFSPLFVIISQESTIENLKPLSILTACLFGLSAICFTFLHIFEVTHVKVHLTLFGIFVCLTMLSLALTGVRGFAVFKTYLEHSKNFIILAISGGFAAVFAILCIFIAFNPKLMFWAKLDKVEGSENEYVRPKKFPLAYSEWATLLLLFMGEICYFLELLVK